MNNHDLIISYLVTMTILCVIEGVRLYNSQGRELIGRGSNNWFLPFLITFLFAYVCGQRQVFFAGFMDTQNYAIQYNNINVEYEQFQFSGEFIWQWLMLGCRKAGFTVSTFFTIVSYLYMFSALLAIRKFTPNNVYLTLLFVFSTLFFYSFATNGLRNGIACNILLLGIAYMFEGNYVMASIITLISFGLHKSTALPIATTITAVFIYRNVEYAIYFWLLSIVASLVAGSWFETFFTNLGFDDRMAVYTGGGTEYDELNLNKFRWDFLLYSSFPVLMAWWVCIKKRIFDNWYNALCCIYILCNAFWVLVIRASYSNRFAYLSWFLYPFVIAYPLIYLPLEEDQDRLTANILFAMIGFTLAMNFIWHNI